MNNDFLFKFSSVNIFRALMSKFLKLKMTNLLTLGILSSKNMNVKRRQQPQKPVDHNFWMLLLLVDYLFYISASIEHCIKGKIKDN